MIEHKNQSAVTLLELLVVVIIMGILASVAVTVYTGHVDRARIAACRDTIRQLELAINRYEVDTGQLPPSSSGLTMPPGSLLYEGNSSQGSFGSGYLQVALIHSLSGNLHQPLHYRWLGPYIQPDEDQLGDRYGNLVTGSVPKGYIQLLDPWGLPYYYLRSDHYSNLGGTQYPSTHPYFSSETYYNPSSFQIFSLGRNGSTYSVPYRGEETDDVNNWRKYGLPYVVASGSRSRRSGSNIRTASPRSRSGRTPGDFNNANQDDFFDRRPNPLTFSMPDNTNLLFRWPPGWEKSGKNKVIKPEEIDTKPQWLFQVSPDKNFEQLAGDYKGLSDVEIIFEGPDPTQTITDSYVLEVRSEDTPEEELAEDAEGKPYHLLFAFKYQDNICWWSSNFVSVDSMEEGRLFITGVTRTKIPVTRNVR